MNSIVITGASGSMGSEAVKAMVARGFPVIMAVRNPAKAGGIRSRILGEFPDARIEIRKVDMGSMHSVREFAAGLGGMELAGLFNCAGVISRSFGISPDGFENTLAVNCIGPMLLTKLLLPQIEDGGHIVNMVSLTTKFAHIDRNILMPGVGKDFHRLRVYGRSKLALLLMSIELADRVSAGEFGAKRIHVNVSDPGIVNSNMISMGRWFDPLADIFFRPLCKSPEKGAAPAVRALTTDAHGKYFVGDRTATIPRRIQEHPLRAWLWGTVWHSVCK